jgi:hypothetical protein
MIQEEQTDSLKALQDIRSIMERSARFISLSGWSGIWAGCMALAGSAVAYNWLQQYCDTNGTVPMDLPIDGYNNLVIKFLGLAIGILLVALAGGYYFTWRKTKRQGGSIWNSASRRMMTQMAIPLTAGGIFALHFLYTGNEAYIAPICLVFYGMALINGSKYTISDIKYLGLCEMALGCICLFLHGYGLIFWAMGFGILHIVYGTIMWNKYDKRLAGKEQQ